MIVFVKMSYMIFLKAPMLNFSDIKIMEQSI